ncbi:MAG: ATP-dependent metallopeptidase FtsH/Yme1/Tma family protein, partial [Coriobacteriales bacterium]|nr:ATP-dependent metallopeptidase FtsH/Yme1/Tma family protein [Coriobacteriales bacterium]
MKKRHNWTWIIYAVVLLALVSLLSSQLMAGFGFTMPQQQTPDQLSTSDFVNDVNNGTITDAHYNAVTGTVTGDYLKDGETDPS